MLQYIRNVTTAKKDEGASAVEYGLLVAAIAAVIVLLVIAVGGYVKGAFAKTCTGLQASGSANNSGQTCAS